MAGGDGGAPCLSLRRSGIGAVLEDSLQIHTLELVRYNIAQSELGSASELDCWLFWLLHAHQYEPEELRKLLPQPAIRQATETLTRIAEITEDKAMYDAREIALRDRKWEKSATFREGERKGRIEGRDQNDPDPSRVARRSSGRGAGTAAP